MEPRVPPEDQTLILYALFPLVAFLSLLATDWLSRRLRRSKLVATSNERSMHTRPTPTGGGMVIVFLTLATWGTFYYAFGTLHAPLIALGVLALAVLSFFDDRHTLPAKVRFIVQGVIVTAALLALPLDDRVFAGYLPLWADRLLAWLGWMWFINLYNFMDGIDGLAGSETVLVALGIALVGWLIHLPLALIALAVALAAAASGFLWWNWQPARIFMGDTGSIPIGFLLGYMLIEIARSGYLAAALLLPLTFLADATLTLLRRLIRGEKVWQAHRSHFYQRAGLALKSHEAVVQRFVLANLALVACAWLSLERPLTGLGLGLLAVAALLLRLQLIAKRG
jgi:UDP-N-acetylmuramyl pentapeptide phosphotransferase/UDP-N-acetylglucosamine-1-phosphate transferase